MRMEPDNVRELNGTELDEVAGGLSLGIGGGGVNVNVNDELGAVTGALGIFGKAAGDIIDDLTGHED